MTTEEEKPICEIFGFSKIHHQPKNKTCHWCRGIEKFFTEHANITITPLEYEHIRKGLRKDWLEEPQKKIKDAM
tara:strand:- start:773 stop:994 length:222 start_codon:yes stop_codon:yes gene_type:complete